MGVDCSKPAFMIGSIICIISENQLTSPAGINQYTAIKIMKVSLFTPNRCLLQLIEKFITYAILQMVDQ